MATERVISRFLLPALVLTVVFSAICVTAQNPVGIWKLNEGSGDMVFDSSGGGHTGEVSGGLIWSREGTTWTVSGDATQKGYVTIPNLELSGSNAVSVTVWVKKNYGSNSGGNVLFESGKNYPTSEPSFALITDDPSCHGIQAVLRGNEGTTANCYGQPTSGVWHHLAAIYDKSQTGGSAVSFYVDGMLQTPSWSLSSATNTDNFSNDPVYLLSQGGLSHFSSGTISDFRVYDGALNSEQVQDIYHETLLASPSPISYVQGNYSDPQSPQTSVTARFNSAQSAGDLNVVVIGWKDTTAQISRVADSAGNTYALAAGPTLHSGFGSQAIYYAKNIAAAGAGTNSVTVTFNTAARSPDLRILEYSGADTNNPLDVTVAGTGNSRNTNSGSATTTSSTDLILGTNLGASITSGPGNNFTKRLLSTPQGNLVEDRSVTSMGSYSASSSIFPAGNWIMQMVAFRSQRTLVSIAVTPANPSIAIGGHQQFTATGTYSDGSYQNLTNSATWTSSATSIATISSTGLATGVASGNTTITATYGSINGSTTLTVTGSGGFSMSASPSSLTVTQGNQGTSTITTTVNNGFNSAISLTASGAPSGTTVSFNPATIPAPGSGSSVMTISVGSSTPTGTYPITVTGTGGGVHQTATVTLTVSAPPTFTLSVSPTSLTVTQGNQGTATVTTTGLNGFNSAISFSTSGAPTGTTVSFSPNPIPAPGTGTSSMSVVVGSNTPAGTYTITIAASGGGVQQTATFSLTVVGASGIVLDGAIHGVHDNGTGASTTAAVSIGTPTAGDLITCEVSFDSGGGNTLVSVADPNNGTYAAAVPAHLNSSLNQYYGIYYAQNVSASATTITLTASQSRDYMAIACQAWKGAATTNSFDSSFAQLQDASGMPNPTTGANKTPSSNGELVIAGVGLDTGGTPTAGTNYALTDGAPTTQLWPEYWVQGTAISTAGNYTWQSDTWTDTMAAFRPLAAGNFTISASPSSLTVAQGNQGASTITTTVSGGFSNSISLSASGVPSGTTVTFNPTSIAAPGSGSSSMSIAVGAGTAAGTYPITVTGTGGGIQQSATVSLTVTAGAGFSISASPASLSIMQGNQGTSTITSVVSGGFSSSISFTASGAPSGTTIAFNPATIPAPGSGNSVMTITVGSTTPMGTYPIVVTASGGGLYQSTTVTLTVTAQIALSWAASQSPGIAGYNVYRSTVSGGPYTKINSSLVPSTSYNDQGVQNGVTYYYVTTAVSNQGMESSYSNQASAMVP